jgi:hypothetical protein
MFQITEFTQAALTSVTNRIEKHGDDDKPAVTLMVEITAPNTLLDTIDAGLRHALYKAKPDSEPELPEMEQSTPVLRTNCIEQVALTVAHEGWSLHLDDGIDETKPIIFGSVKVDKLKVDAKQGGSIVLKLRMGTSDVDADRLGMLGMHNGQDIWMKLLPPEKPAAGATEATGAAIDGTKGHPGAANAGQGSLLDSGDDGPTNGDDTGEGDGLGGFDDDMARGSGDPEPDDDGSGHPDAEQSAEQPAGDPQRGENWPFPKGSELSDEQRSQASREADLQAEAAAPKGARRQRKAVAGAVE